MVDTNPTRASKRNVLTQTIVVLCIFLVLSIGGYIWRSNDLASQSTASQATLSGQLKDFIKIENDMLKDVNSKNFTATKKGADDLEHQWDSSEAKLRKIDGSKWTKIDGTIDVVLAAARSSNPYVNKCKSALNNSLTALNAANK